MAESTASLFEKLSRMDRRWIFLVLGVTVLGFVAVPGLLPELPTVMTQPARDYAQAVDALQEGDTVLLGCDYDPGSIPELQPMHFATLRQILRKRVKVIAVTLWETGPAMAGMGFDKIVPEVEAELGVDLVEGEDYLDLGFKSGREVAMSSMGKSIPDTFPRVSYGGREDVSFREVPILKDLKDFEQIALLVDISAGYPGVREWLRTVQAIHGVKIVAGVTSVMAPDLFSFHQSGQLVGFLPGAAGADMYEATLRDQGQLMEHTSIHEAMSIQSVAQFLIIGFILIGNIGYFLSRKQEA